MAHLKAWGFSVGCIHGGMKPGSRDEPGSRLHTEQQFPRGRHPGFWWPPRRPAKASTCSAATSSSTTISRGTRTGSNSAWAAIHRYGQHHDCLIFNFVASNTIEGRVLQRLLYKLQEIRDALDDDAVFNVVGEVLPSAHVERVLRDYYAGKLGDADLEERLLKDVDEGHFRAICQTALEGLAAKRLNLDMLIERRARAQERRVVPETLARFICECARDAALALKPVSRLVAYV